jgi:hypothetical protein
MKSELEGQYVVLTCTTSFRQRYVIPTEALQSFNEEVELTAELAKQWAGEAVHAQELKEFSQKYLGEEIVDEQIVDQARMLELFDDDNKYLSEGPDGWSHERKLRFINDWKEKQPGD